MLIFTSRHSSNPGTRLAHETEWSKTPTSKCEPPRSTTEEFIRLMDFGGTRGHGLAAEGVWPKDFQADHFYVSSQLVLKRSIGHPGP